MTVSDKIVILLYHGVVSGETKPCVVVPFRSQLKDTDTVDYGIKDIVATTSYCLNPFTLPSKIHCTSFTVVLALEHNLQPTKGRVTR
jgi:hypothetical protein